MNPAVYDERQQLASLIRDTNHVTALRLGIFGIDLPQYLLISWIHNNAKRIDFNLLFMYSLLFLRAQKKFCSI